MAQTSSPINTTKGGKLAPGTTDSEKNTNPISIVHLNGSTLFSAQSAPFHSYSASTSTTTLSCILSIQKSMVVRVPANARLQVSFNTPKSPQD